MPELPDLEYVVPILGAELVGRRIEAIRVDRPIVLRLAVEGDPSGALVGRTFEQVERHGPFVRFRLSDGLQLVVHPMLAGRFALAAQGSRGHVDLAVTFELDDGRELRYRDDKQMGKVWVIADGKEDTIPGFAKVGVPVLDPGAFTWPVFQELARKRRDQVKAFLLDHAALDTLGNAYSDEVLWEARIHPKARVRELSEQQLRALYEAIPAVLGRARDEIASRKPALDEKLRDFLAVRNRKGKPCPRCTTTIRVAGMHGHDAFFCPQCQPDVKGRGFVDWSKLRP